jgi:tetratricopeptide (TPR) repeat protein
MEIPIINNDNDRHNEIAPATVQKAVQLMDRGRFREAALIFERAVADDPENASALCNLGICLMRLEKWGLAGNAIRRYVDLAPEDFLGHLRLGMILRELGFPAKSLRILNQALKKDPQSALAWNQLGQTYLRMEKPSKARECFVRAIRLRPNYTSALCGLAEVYEQKGLTLLAIDLCRQALRDCPAGKTEQVRAVLQRIEGKSNQG